MAKIKMLKEPGFIHDLLFVFYLKFNYNLVVKDLEKKFNIAKDGAFFQSISNMFGDISEDLFVFFHAFDNNQFFLQKYYVAPYHDKYATTYNFTFLQDALTDQDVLVKNAISSYFPDLSNEQVQTCFTTPKALYTQIKNSNYTGEVKSKLYEFFLDPAPYIQKLQFALLEKKPLLEQYYESNYQKIHSTHNSVSIELLNEQLKEVEAPISSDDDQTLYTSYCLLNKYLICRTTCQSAPVYLLGCDYAELLEHLSTQSTSFDLVEFGHALGDDNRGKILQLLLERTEVTRKDLERLFSISGTTAYHHITTLTNAGLLIFRHEGKTIYYRLNRACFSNAIDALYQYSTKEKPQ